MEDPFFAHIKKMDAQSAFFQVPDFPLDSTWYNSDPISLKQDLLGKLTVLDFWSYCFINCIHTLPDLAFLEEKYSHEPVVFIGVHSAKFENEKQENSLRQAVLRYEIKHPVVNDVHMSLWKHLGIHHWPTLVLIGPKGNLLYNASGEGKKQELDQMIQAALKFYASSLNFKDRVTKKKESHSQDGLLYFPSKLALNPEDNELIISDSNHHRIIIVSHSGKLKYAIGSGKSGFVDGTFNECAFNRPQGIFYQNHALYIADTENHAIRKVDFKLNKVSTLLGNGNQGHDLYGGNKGTLQSISSPWDLIIVGNLLYIAMAGTHQIWTFDFDTHIGKVFSGSGQELNLNSRDLLKAGWAQPSGLAFDMQNLYIADSESSSIRAINLLERSTRTIVGGDSSLPQNLFASGDQKGIGTNARLQHPLGVIWIEKMKSLVIADTYNHRLKILDPHLDYVENWVGSGIAGFKDGIGLNAQFFEPSGFALSPDQSILFVADTNNHAIRKINLYSLEVETFSLHKE